MEEPNWDNLYFLCKKFYNMSLDEFMYDHDIDLTYYLITEELKLRNPEFETTQQPPETRRATEFL